MAYYGENDVNGDDVKPRDMITEAVNLANPDVNYANYDNDNNGFVDGVYVIFSGYGEEAGASDDAIWSHAWSIPTLTLDGKSVSTYSCSPELRSNSGSGISRIGVICHEFGHVLGAPDYYDTDYSESGGQFPGTGYWDVMGSGSWNNGQITPGHHNAFTKTYIYGWAGVTELSSPATLTLYHAKDSTNSFYQINTTTTDEFFIMENRSQAGFDSYIPGEGLIIYHVHEDILSGFAGGDINVTHPQMFYPVCASATSNPGSTPSSYGSINTTGCPFPGSSSKTSFTDATIPGARSWAGANTSQPLTNIAFNSISNVVTLDYMGGSSATGEDCADAISLAASSGSIDYSTTGFTNDYNSACGGNGEDRVYHLITPVGSGDSLAIWITDDDYDIVFYATYGSCEGTSIGCINDPDAGILTWTNNTGSSQEVWIYVDGNAGSDGSATLNWSIFNASGSGEDCDNVIQLSGISGSVDFSTDGYADDYFSDCRSSTDAEIVYHLTTGLANNATLNFWTTDDDYDVVIYARMGSCTGTEIACIDDPDGTTLTWLNTTGTTQEVWIFADGYGGSSGSATLNWSIEGSQEGDDCNSAIVISGMSGSQEYTTSGYANDYNLPCEEGGEDVVFYLETPVSPANKLYLWTAQDDYNVLFAATYGSCLGNLVACHDSPDGEAVSWTNNTNDDQNIWIFVDGYNGDDGSAVLHWEIEDPDDLGEEESQNMLLYPNPASDRVMLSAKDGQIIGNIRIYNAYGVLVHESSPATDAAEIDISEFPAGTYVVNISGENFVTRSTLVVVR